MRRTHKPSERGSSLIIVILVIAFMLAVGIALLTTTGTAPKISGNVRDQEEAFNTAEAGFEAARVQISNYLTTGVWVNFQSNCLKVPAGIDLPLDVNYFRKRTDTNLVQSLIAGNTGLIFLDQPFIHKPDGSLDTTRTYTVFLIDNEAGAPVSNSSDAILVCIGVIRSGTRILATSRLEIVLGIQTGGTNP